MKLILPLIFLSSYFFAFSQVEVKGISPAAISGYYPHTWSSPATNWNTLDISLPNTFVQDTLIIVDDGTPGVSSHGFNNSTSGCNPILNDLTGKIAILNRGCAFSIQALNAQNAGAVGVIIISYTEDVFGMGPTLPSGPNVTIPIVLLRKSAGMALLNEMASGPVEVFMGNKTTHYTNDLRVLSGLDWIPNLGSRPDAIDNKFQVGTAIYNIGSANQSGVSVNAKITGPTGVVYDQTISGLTINVGDTLSLIPNMANSFPDYNLGGIGNYSTGSYNLKYEVILSVTDEDTCDNISETHFNISPDVLSLANLSPITNLPEVTNYEKLTANNSAERCISFIDSNASSLIANGMHFRVDNDGGTYDLSGETITSYVYEWDNVIGNIGTTTPIDISFFYIGSNAQNQTDLYIPFTNNIYLKDNQHYLFCLSYNEYLKVGMNENYSLAAVQNNSNANASLSGIDYNFSVSTVMPAIGINVTNCSNFNAGITDYRDACFGLTSGYVKAEVQSANGPYTYLWNNGSISDTLDNLSPGVYTVTITDSIGCMMVDSVTIIEQPLVVATLNSTGTNLACGINSVTLTTQSSYASYNWSTGDISPALIVTNGDLYSVQVTDSIGCVGSSDSIYISNSFLTAPEVCLVSVDTLSNANTVVWEKPISIGIDSFYVYRETITPNVFAKLGSIGYNEVSVFTDNLANPGGQSHSYKISAIDTCGGESEKGGFQKTVFLSVVQGVGFTWDLSWTPYEGQAVSSYNIYSGTDPNAMTLLMNVGNTTNNITDFGAPIASTSFYRVEALLPNTCDPAAGATIYSNSWSNIGVSSAVGLNEITASGFAIYPNPTTSFVFIEKPFSEEKIWFELSDLSGKVIYRSELADLKTKVDLENLSKGVYFINIQGKKTNITSKVIKK